MAGVLGFTYDDIDDLLEGRAIDETIAQRILDKCQATAHKRQLPASPVGAPRGLH